MLYVITGPSGCGKTTLVRKILEEVENLEFSVSHTTRKKRGNEEADRDYYFVSETEFQKMIEDNALAEWAKVHTNFYGTSKAELERENPGKDIILDIDIQGAQQIKKKYKNAVFIFILPPAFDELKQRLIKRARESLDVIQGRLEVARKEIRAYPDFDYIIVNDRLEKALLDLKSIVLGNAAVYLPAGKKFSRSFSAFQRKHKMEEKKKIALGVSSSISVYKSCEIVRGFQKKGYDVHVIMTKNAARLISPLLFSALTGNKVRIDPFEEESSEKIAHVSLSREISLFLVAPATANIIGKFASGIADDFLSTFFMTVNCPVLIAPAMNEAMYLHKQTQKNIQKLRKKGVKFVAPEQGYLACKEEGLGRLADPDLIIKAGEKMLKKSLSLAGKTVLITAGPTREFLDPIRFLSNRSSGKMGFELAEEALRRGADVILVSGPTNLFPPRGVKFHSIQTAGEMEEKVLESYDNADVVIMAAAVSDIRFEEKSVQKIKKQNLSEDKKMVRTTDILASLGRKKGEKILVGFAAETENIERNALDKMKRKNLDLIVANDVSCEGIGFESDFNRVIIFSHDGKPVDSGKKSKHRVSEMILDKIEGIIGEKN